MGQTNYTINEYGEIVREDYFCTSVKGTAPQLLPTNRKVWKVWLLSMLTLGIYGMVITFAMAKETNISCAEDGKHTRNVWGAIFLSIITLGIYGFIWNYKWANREYKFLARNTQQGGLLSGGGYVALSLINAILSGVMQCLPAFVDPYYQPETYLITFGVVSLLVIFWGIYVMSRWLKQHNAVNKLYNLRTFGTKA